MSLQYPHLTDATNFPNVQQIAPYAQYKNEFDYTRWTPGVTLTVCNVPWDGVRNIVQWDDDTTRDQWFNTVQAHRETLQTEFHMLPDGVIKLPIPFATMSRYNYVFITYPTPTTPTTPLDYAKEPRTRSWGFFIDSPTQLAANTTECHLRLDAWTTFGVHTHFNYCQLKRGHAPLAALTADDYLNNPIEHSGLLLTPDVTYGPEAAITRDHKFIPWNSGTKLVMFASSISPEGFTTAGVTKDWNGAATAPQYADNPARWGHQYDVSNYDWNMGDSDMRDLTTPTDTYYSSDGVIPNAIHVYAVEANNADTLFTTIVTRMPQVLQTIKAVWIVPSDLVSMGTTVDIAGITIHECNSVNDMPDIAFPLRKSMFNYDQHYADIAKLYTFPYAALELSDNDGTTVTIRVENTGVLNVHRRVSIAYPYLKAQAFLTGVNGVGAQTYEWTDLNNTTHETQSWDTNFSEFMCKYDIPTYGLYVSGITDWSLHNQLTNIDAERLKALNSYHVGMRNANTSYENAKNNTNLTYDNTNRSATTALSNATASADTGQTVTNDSAQTNYENTLRSNATNRTNTHNTNTTTKTNADANANTTLANGNASAATTQTNANAAAYATEQNAFASNKTAQDTTNRSADTTITNMNNSISTNDANMELRISNRTADMTNYTGTASDINLNQNRLTVNNINADIQFMDAQYTINADAAAVSAIGSSVGSLVQGNVAGAVSSLVGGAVSIAKDAAIKNATITLNTTKATNSLNNARDNTTATNDNSETINNNANSNDRATTKNNNNLNRTNTTNDANTTKANAAEVRATGDSNATRIYGMSTANNARTYDMTVSNNQRSNTTSLANNKRQFDTSELNADNLKNTGDTNATAANDVAHRNSKRSRDTGVSNATASKNTTIENADATKTVTLNNILESREASEFANKTALEQAEDVTQLAYAQAKNNAPVFHGAYNGDPTPDMFAYRGVQIRVKTQSESAIRQAGDQFLRYGYAYEGNWNISTLRVMPKFSYWQMEEVWLDVDTDIMEEAKNSIRELFENGVTVWTNPNDIGKVGLYDNR